MNANDISEALLEGLIELELAGDLVVTHSAPLELAERLRSKLVERWAKEFVGMPPHEVVIADSISGATWSLQVTFGVPYPQALSAVERFVEDRQAERSLAELADLLSHQGHREIALGAYYCVHMGRGIYYDPDYLTWRSSVARSA